MSLTDQEFAVVRQAFPDAVRDEWRKAGDGFAHVTAWVGANARVGDGATVCDGATVGARATVGDGVTVEKTSDMIVMGPGGSRSVMATFTKTHVGTGCFWGTRDEFAKRVEATHGNNEHGQWYRWCLRVTAERFAELDGAK